ncbi:MAG: hypothetical protein A3F26_03505 [Candidatus Ryanbacteria bacterium RIFCSPHIGHO2_12_FULL_47_12b]|nr:MAG: hypothetical protein A3C83_02090 [Candidatus Ryanbacteria bacterium RIFCSPHIGHO2_02_FULL_47_25]OGZ53050.1 MAG: hypothetical protein A3F26_03505 [Candidatus Ryanbacteria bacterium RIFCSPHIGHO2_12_FULL_47_12b]
MRAYYGTEGIVLAAYDRGEADRCITFFTRDFGRVDAVAKGLRVISSKLRGHLTLFSRVRLLLTPGKEYWRILDAETKDGGLPPEAPVQDFVNFLLALTVSGVPDSRIWEVIISMRGAKSREDFFMNKIYVLETLGILPAQEKLKYFFSPRACAYIVGMSRDKFLENEEEVLLIALGIKKILSANHMV